MYEHVIFIIGIIIPSGYSAPKNEALNKPTTISSRYLTNQSAAWSAVDGNTGSSFYTDFCATTAPDDENPWWMVDLKSNYFVRSVTLTNRDDSWENLRFFVIEIFLINPAWCEKATPTVCYNHTEASLGMSETRNIICDRPTKGRFVRIRKWITGNSLSLCEVEVFGAQDIHSCENPSYFPRVRGTHLVSVYSEDVTTYLLECLLFCSEDIKCVAFNYNTVDEQCELIFHPEFGDTAEKDSMWDYYGSDLC